MSNPGRGPTPAAADPPPAAADPAQAELAELEELARQAGQPHSLDEALELLARAGRLASGLRRRIAACSGKTTVIRTTPGGSPVEEPFDVQP